MLIKNKFYVITAVAFILFLVPSFLIYGALHEIEEEIEENKVVNSVFKDVIDLGFLTGEYLFNHEEETANQWKLKHESFSTTLDTNKDIFGSSEEHRSMSVMSSNKAEIMELFLKFEETIANDGHANGVSDHGGKLEEELLLTKQINVALQEIHEGAYDLSAEVLHEIEEQQQMISLIIFIANASLALVIVVVFLTMLKNIRAIGKLTEGAKMIGDGRFNKKIDINSKDEIGDLADSFNKMAYSLNDFYGKLDAKVKERTEELNDLKDNLEKEVDSRTFEVKKLKDNLEKEVKKQTEELNQKIEELERINQAMVGRELEMVKLKEKIESLEAEKKL